jgi:hypothetical protein
MKSLRESSMKNVRNACLSYSALVLIVLLLVAGTLTGCGQPGVIVAIEPTATAYPPSPTDVPPPPPGPTPEAFDFPLAAPTNVEETEPVTDQACVDCHTDEEGLKALAEDEEKPAVESEGEG